MPVTKEVDRMLDRKTITLVLGGAALVSAGGCSSISDQDEPIEIGPAEETESVGVEGTEAVASED